MTVAADRLVEVGFNTNPRYGALDDRREDAIARVVGAVPAFLGGGGHERLVPDPDDRAAGVPDVQEASVALHQAPDGYFEVMGLVAARGETTSHLVVRTHGLADAMLPTIRAAALSEAPDVPITTARTRASTEAETRRGIMWGVIAAGASGAVAPLLAAIGLYAVVAVSVGQRRREIAVRSALGADGRSITAVFVKRGLVICIVGAVIGLGLSTVAYRVMAEAQMFGQSASTSVGGSVIALVTVFVFAVALVASWIPARRAAAVDPWSVLRSE